MGGLGGWGFGEVGGGYSELRLSVERAEPTTLHHFCHGIIHIWNETIFSPACCGLTSVAINLAACVSRISAQSGLFGSWGHSRSISPAALRALAWQVTPVSSTLTAVLLEVAEVAAGSCVVASDSGGAHNVLSPVFHRGLSCKGEIMAGRCQPLTVVPQYWGFRWYCSSRPITALNRCQNESNKRECSWCCMAKYRGGEGDPSSGLYLTLS